MSRSGGCDPDCGGTPRFVPHGGGGGAHDGDILGGDVRDGVTVAGGGGCDSGLNSDRDAGGGKPLRRHLQGCDDARRRVGVDIG